MSTSTAHDEEALGKPKHLNRLAKAKSPYLLQHAENPVDWYEWGPEAFEKAKREDKPIFLSVGYSACHWCHVLAHESFEDVLTAKLMNEHYVNIKVDREERPDVDRLYMTYLQATTGGGGWPMSVWLTPELHPFFAGTYFPPGRFRGVLAKLAEVWQDDPERCRSAGQQVIEQLREATETASSPSNTAPLPIPALAHQAYSRLAGLFDSTHGGFGRAPKFPQVPATTGFLARFAHTSSRSETAESDRDAAANALEMAAFTMGQIYAGGVHDHVGGGVARYSVDARWHVPHFEKMLYDQAQLLRSALELYLLYPAGSPHRAPLLALAQSIVGYLPVLTSAAGGFLSAEDADSLPAFDSTKTREGAFYTWTAGEIDEALAGLAGTGVIKAAEVFRWAYGVEEGGNCDPQSDPHGELKGQNVLYLAHTHEETAQLFGVTVAEAEQLLQKILAVLKEWREKHRPRPHLDDKVVAGWNGLMISGLALASEVFPGEQGAEALRMAEGAARFIKEMMYDSATGELCRSWREGKGPRGVADDYAFLIQGLLDLYEASGKEEYALWAIRLQSKQDELFFDEEGGGYFASAPDPHVLIRMKDAQDGAEPSAAAVTLANLGRLAHFAEDARAEYEEQAESVLRANAQMLEHTPGAVGAMVGNALVRSRGYVQVVVTGPPESAMLRAVRARFMPQRVLIHLDPGAPPQGLAKVNGTLRSVVDEVTEGGEGVRPNVRVCRDFTCGLPIYELSELASALGT
ncbi:hypothetical protein FOMPIDRAFT_138440 [Fomitopsis schrenkii]|uniref:Spermatogenesis-associated protein 20-like TRX domain-containing protein n=1 Tax=Fomitopsis schrenkii TaxID=2126942 RepID=S8EKT9_FOMSC|nr:hypothetical protein FOMPIDRAFT_138440 [Fomitopsis schrenkii]